MARRRYAERLAEEILERYPQEQFKVDPRHIAEALGARLVEEHSEDDKAGLVARDGKRIVIGVNASHAPVRKRFTVAHEIGHMLIHASEPLIVDSGGYALIGERREGATSDREIEANAFAAALLMPPAWIKKALQRLEGRGIDLADDADVGVRQLAHEFGVSAQAMMFRLINLGYLQNL